jgi:hypothetical protein
LTAAQCHKVPRCRVLKRPSKPSQQRAYHHHYLTLHHLDRDHRSPPTQLLSMIRIFLRAYTSETSKVVIHRSLPNIPKGIKRWKRNGRCEEDGRNGKDTRTVRIHDRTFVAKQSDVMVINLTGLPKILHYFLTTVSRSFSALTCFALYICCGLGITALGRKKDFQFEEKFSLRCSLPGPFVAVSRATNYWRSEKSW